MQRDGMTANIALGTFSKDDYNYEHDVLLVTPDGYVDIPDFKVDSLPMPHDHDWITVTGTFKSVNVNGGITIICKKIVDHGTDDSNTD